MAHLTVGESVKDNQRSGKYNMPGKNHEKIWAKSHYRWRRMYSEARIPHDYSHDAKYNAVKEAVQGIGFDYMVRH
jgi:hypothetical protein